MRYQEAPITDHVFEVAPSGRSKCRSCGKSIAKDSIRFGEVTPNPFGDGNMTQWHHPRCAAFRRPEPLLASLKAEAPNNGTYTEPDRAELTDLAEANLPHRRLQRLGKAERASSGRARCRSCRELIEKEAWRLPLIFFEDGNYANSGFIHASCVQAYCETEDVLDTVKHFAEDLEKDDLDELIEIVSAT